mmetsp:Transcript_38860/g.51210  ORF Transcript_38860/g.51210 Transcript_38860/m.51210 type:complete len:99 (-) Transcript_38860:179-475(-)
MDSFAVPTEKRERTPSFDDHVPTIFKARGKFSRQKVTIFAKIYPNLIQSTSKPRTDILGTQSSSNSETNHWANTSSSEMKTPSPTKIENPTKNNSSSK